MSRSAILITVLCAALAGCQKASTSADLSLGKALFDENCAPCHGPAGDVRSATEHDPKTPDLRTIAGRSAGGRVPRVMLAEIIDGRRIVQAHGRTMPIWGEQLESDDGVTVDAKIDALLAYIESIQTR